MKITAECKCSGCGAVKKFTKTTTHSYPRLMPTGWNYRSLGVANRGHGTRRLLCRACNMAVTAAGKAALIKRKKGK